MTNRIFVSWSISLIWTAWLLLIHTADFGIAVDSSHSSLFVPILGYTNSDDRAKLKTYFEQAAAEAKLEPSKAYYILKGFTAIAEKPPGKSFCSALSVPLSTSELAFYHSSGIKMLSNTDCKVSVTALKDLASKRLTESIPIEELFYITTAMRDAGLSVDAVSVSNIITKIKAKDSSPTTMALIFHVVSQLNMSKTELLPYVNAMSGILDFADELNGQQLYFEKGLYTTALVAQGISDLITAYGDAKDIPEKQLVKLINFMYVRLHSSNLRAAAFLASSLKSITDNPYLAPVVIESHMGVSTAGEVHRQQPTLNLKLKSLWGELVPGTELTLKAGGLYAVDPKTNEKTLIGPTERGKFTFDDSSAYRLSLAEVNGPALPPPGRYELEVSADWTRSNRKKLLGLTRVKIPVRVVADAKVIEPVLTLFDSSNDRHLADISLTFGQRYKSSTPNGAINLETSHQLSLTLRLVDATDSSVSLTAHQMFLQLTHHNTEQAITFLFSETSSIGAAKAKTYRVRLDPDHSAADFDFLDGVYKMELIMGDPFLRNPMLWYMADLDLHFSGAAGSDSARRSTEANDVSQQRAPSPAAMKRAGGPSALLGPGPTKAKPEIEHMFRAPEKRAPRTLAWAFTIACAVPPIILLVVWTVIGVNIWNFSFRLSNLLFHTGLMAIFCLYFVYWFRLNMFTTLGYLVMLGIPTFLAGNSVLRAQLSARMAASSAKK